MVLVCFILFILTFWVLKKKFLVFKSYTNIQNIRFSDLCLWNASEICHMSFLYCWMDSCLLTELVAVFVWPVWVKETRAWSNALTMPACKPCHVCREKDRTLLLFPPSLVEFGHSKAHVGKVFIGPLAGGMWKMPQALSLRVGEGVEFSEACGLQMIRGYKTKLLPF